MQIRAILAEVLSDRGHEVVALADGLQAWTRCQLEPPPLVVLDVGLPGLDGLELCRRLRTLPDGDRVFVIVVTARSQAADLSAALDAGADDYLTKPFELARLEARLAIAERRIAERASRVRATRQRVALIEATRVVAASAGRDLDATLGALADQARGLFEADETSIELTTADGGEGPALSADRGVMSVPLRAEGRPVGMLHLRWQRPPAIGEEELAVAAAFGEHAAIAIRTARLVEAAEHAGRMIVAAADQERRVVAERLHSRVKSKLVVVWYRIDQCARLLGPGQEGARDLLAQALTDLDRVRAEDVDEIGALLYPSKVNFGLTAAIETLARELDDRLAVTLEVDDAVRALDRFADSQIPDDVRLAAYRIVEAALDNVLRHARARRVDVSVGVDAQGRLALAVADDGRGVDPAAVDPGVGLTSVEARVRLLGGAWTLALNALGGTTLSARLPLPTG